MARCSDREGFPSTTARIVRFPEFILVIEATTESGSEQPRIDGVSEDCRDDLFCSRNNSCLEIN
jgi:hypothetical protein